MYFRYFIYFRTLKFLVNGRKSIDHFEHLSHRRTFRSLARFGIVRRQKRAFARFESSSLKIYLWMPDKGSAPTSTIPLSARIIVADEFYIDRQRCVIVRFAPRNLLHFFPFFFLIRPASRVHAGEQRTERKGMSVWTRERKGEGEWAWHVKTVFSA